MYESFLEYEAKIADCWCNYDYLQFDEMIKDFKSANSSNIKVKRFKELLEKYSQAQKDFEMSGEIFSPFCIGYGNITSPIWFLGKNEGGPPERVKENQRYNEEVKTKNVLDQNKILQHVLVNPYDLNNVYGIGRPYYSNFDYAVKITLTSLRILWPDKLTIRKLVGRIQFFTEYWRYRGQTLPFSSSLNWNNDLKRLEFLRDLASALQPIVIVCYCGANYKNKIMKLFNTNEFNFTDETFNEKYDKNKQWIMITRFLGQNCSDDIAKHIGETIGRIWNIYQKT